jgi:hypothetical protein
MFLLKYQGSAVLEPFPKYREGGKSRYVAHSYVRLVGARDGLFLYGLADRRPS